MKPIKVRVVIRKSEGGEKCVELSVFSSNLRAGVLMATDEAKSIAAALIRAAEQITGWQDRDITFTKYES